MEIPIFNGIFTDSSPSIRASYPVNLTPVLQQSGVSKGYLRPADGITTFADGPGIDRGGINWNGRHIRVMGSKLVEVSAGGSITTLGDVGAGGQVSMDYSFDDLGICAGENVFYWDGSTLTEIVDPDLGEIIDLVFCAGIFVFTDGINLVCPDTADPTSISSFRYGSAELDPDQVLALKSVRGELHVIGRHTIEVFRSIESSSFPFQPIAGAQVQKGAVGTHAVCNYGDALAFVGSGRNEQPSVYLASGGNYQKVSTREIDELLEFYTEAELAGILCETRNDRSSMMLYIHLPDRTLVFDQEASQAAGELIWSVLTSAIIGFDQYEARNFVYHNRKWVVGHPTLSKLGVVDDSIGSHYGAPVRWEFATAIMFTDQAGAVFNQLELVTLTGSVALGANPQISTSYSIDGQTWSQARTISAGGIGDRLKRLVWRRQGFMKQMRIQRFTGDSSAHLSFLRLDADVGILNG